MSEQAMVSCGLCRERKRSIDLWSLPRSGAPVRHVGLPKGWGIVRGMPYCEECFVTSTRAKRALWSMREAARKSKEPTHG